MPSENVNESKPSADASQSCGDYAPATMVKQECPDKIQSSAGACTVKEEPDDDPVESTWEIMVEIDPSPVTYTAEHSKVEAPAPLINIVKSESTLIQTLDSSLIPNHSSAPDSTAPSAEAPAAAISATGHKNRSKLIKARKRTKLQYSCDVCNEMFIDENLLSKHKLMHSKRTPNIHNCHVCNQEFYWKGHLTSHMNTHTKRIKWKCDVCSKVFYRKSNLNCHMNIHSKPVNFECEICHKVFSHKSDFKRHMNIHSKLVKR